MSDAINFIINTIKGYYNSAHHISGVIIQVLLLFEIIFIGIKISLGDINSLVGIIKKILYIGFWIYIINNIDVLSEAFINTLMFMSAKLSDTTTSVDFFDNPFKIIEFAYNHIIQFLLEKIDSMAKIRNILKSLTLLVIIFLLVLLIIGVAVSFAIITLVVLFIQLEFYIIVLCAILLLPFMISEHTKFIAEKIIPTITSQGIKMMVVSIVVQVILAGYANIFDQFRANDSIGFKDMLYIGTIIGLGVYLVLQSQSYAQSLMSGISQSNVGQQAMGAMVGAFTAYKTVSAAKSLSDKTSSDKEPSMDTNKHLEHKHTQNKPNDRRAY